MRLKFTRFLDTISLALAITLMVASIIASFIPLSGRAQAEIKLTTLEVDLWPEYDHPGVLVIYRITLSPEVTLPVDLILRIPAEAGDPSAVAVKEAAGGSYDITYSREVNGEWGKIKFTATMPEIHVEYYDPRLTKQGNARHFEYNWPGEYSVDALTVQVQQPLDATDMRTTPAMGNGIEKEDGLTYYTTQAGSLVAGQTFALTLDYQKPNDALSAERIQVKPSAPVSSITSKQRNLMIILPWVLGILGVGLIVGGGWWYWLSGVKITTSKPTRRHRKLVITQEGAPEEGYQYCNHCGKRAMPSDRFCRACGTRLHT